VEVDVRLGSDTSYLVHLLEHTGLIVRHHDADKPGIGTQSSANVPWIYQTLAVHAHVRNLTSTLLQPLAGIEHGMMLDCGGDDVVFRLDDPENGQIVRLSTATGEDYLRRPAPEELRNRLAGPLDCCPRMLSVMMDRRGIPELF
jgi:hypothetical protein